MSGTDRTERINVFPVDEEYLFKHYFERNDVFEAISEYYDRDEYRFGVPEDEFDDVRATLAQYSYDLILLEDLARFCVVKEQYTKHADILRNSVANWSRRGYNFFLMKDERSVQEAIERGATRIEDTDLVIGL